MDGLIAACGLVCSDCDAYKATKNNDAEAVAKVAREWGQLFSADIKPEQVWCEGCMTDNERKCSHCAECDIRDCVTSKGLDNCAACEQYACERISRFFENVPCCKGRLDEIRAQTNA